MPGAELAQNGGDADGVRQKGGENRRLETPGRIAASTIPTDVGAGGRLHHRPAKFGRPTRRIGSAEILLPPRLLVPEAIRCVPVRSILDSWHRKQCHPHPCLPSTHELARKKQLPQGWLELGTCALLLPMNRAGLRGIGYHARLSCALNPFSGSFRPCHH